MNNVLSDTSRVIRFGSLVVNKRSYQRVIAVIRFLFIDMTTAPLKHEKYSTKPALVNSTAGFFMPASRTPYDNKTANRVRGRKDESLLTRRLTSVMQATG
jgi:hypothetical protein